MLASAEDLAQFAEGLSELDRTGLNVMGTVEFSGIRLPITFDPDRERHVVTMAR